MNLGKRLIDICNATKKKLELKIKQAESGQSEINPITK